MFYIHHFQPFLLKHVFGIFKMEDLGKKFNLTVFCQYLFHFENSIEIFLSKFFKSKKYANLGLKYLPHLLCDLQGIFTNNLISTYMYILYANLESEKNRFFFLVDQAISYKLAIFIQSYRFLQVTRLVRVVNFSHHNVDKAGDVSKLPKLPPYC